MSWYEYYWGSPTSNPEEDVKDEKKPVEAKDGAEEDKDVKNDSDVSFGSDIFIAEEGVSANRPSELERADNKEEHSHNVSSISSFRYS